MGVVCTFPSKTVRALAAVPAAFQMDRLRLETLFASFLRFIVRKCADVAPMETLTGRGDNRKAGKVSVVMRVSVCISSPRSTATADMGPMRPC